MRPVAFCDVGQEPERGTGEFTHRLTVVRLPDGHDQQTGHVVDAVSVFTSRHVVVRVFEHPDVVGHRQHVPERRQGHEATAHFAATRASPSRAYRRATADHDSSGASRRASAAIDAASRGLVRTDRIAVGERFRVTLRHDDAGAARQQLDRVRKGGGNDGSSGRDRVHQDPGRDLIARVVRQHHQVGGLDQLGQRLEIPVGVVEHHVTRHTRRCGPVDEHVPIRLTVRARAPSDVSHRR